MALIFATGMSATADDIRYLWQRPALLLRSIVAMYVVMPVVAVVMVRVLALPPKTELALVVLAICAGAPLVPKKLIKLGGNPSFVFSLIVTTSLLAIVTVPLSLHLLAGRIAFETESVTAAGVARVILKSFLVPLGAGMLVRILAPDVADRVGDVLLRVAGAVMGTCALVALAFGFRLVFEVGLPTVLAFAVFTLTALVSGHLLGGPEPQDRTSLAVACASRHVGLALLIATTARGPHTLAYVVAYLLASALVSIPYMRWRSKLTV
jgi:BASS family bile acid:Na+ symporter